MALCGGGERQALGSRQVAGEARRCDARPSASDIGAPPPPPRPPCSNDATHQQRRPVTTPHNQPVAHPGFSVPADNDDERSKNTAKQTKRISTTFDMLYHIC